MEKTNDKKITPGRMLLGVVWQVAFFTALFWPAGTLKWIEGWIFYGLLIVFSAVTSLTLRKHDPALLRERMGGVFHEDQPLYDKIFFVLFIPGLAAWMIVTGLDHRFGWSRMEPWVQMIGGAWFVLSQVLLFIVFTSNTFLAPVVRVQEERKHHVIDTGPYGFVRHPMYAAFLPMMVGGSLLLGSYWSVVVGLAMMVLLGVRCVLEEGTLMEGLEGYEAYTRKVRYRMIPGVW